LYTPLAGSFGGKRNGDTSELGRIGYYLKEQSNVKTAECVKKRPVVTPLSE
jgi:hypothetical protein